MNDYAFDYGQSWREDVISDENGTPYKFYMTKGHHTLRMEVVLGEFSEIVGLVETPYSSSTTSTDRLSR